jgi:hypothetical protein
MPRSWNEPSVMRPTDSSEPLRLKGVVKASLAKDPAYHLPSSEPTTTVSASSSA